MTRTCACVVYSCKNVRIYFNLFLSLQMLREQCLKLFQNEDIKRDVHGLLKSVIAVIYNELYPYVLLICIYNVFLLILILGILFMLYRVSHISVLPGYLSSSRATNDFIHSPPT